MDKKLVFWFCFIFFAGKRKRNMKKIVFGLILTAIFFVTPTECYGQLGVEDAMSVEAGIYSHKKAGHKILFRQTQEALNMLLMDSVMTSSGEYKNIHDELDKYYQAFNLVKLSLDAIACGVQIKNDVDNMGEDMGKIISLLADYKKYCSKHGIDFKESIGVYASFEKHGDEILFYFNEVYNTVGGYAQSIVTKSATTEQVLMGILDISDAIQHARKAIGKLYRSLYYTIMIRRGYWNSNWEHYVTRSVGEHTHDAMERWHKAMTDNLEQVNKK